MATKFDCWKPIDLKTQNFFQTEFFLFRPCAKVDGLIIIADTWPTKLNKFFANIYGFKVRKYDMLHIITKSNMAAIKITKLDYSC